MTTPTPRTDAGTLTDHSTELQKWQDACGMLQALVRCKDNELAQARASVENYASAAEELRQEINELHNRSRAELAQRDALIQRILDYPYLPQNLATIIRKELENV